MSTLTPHDDELLARLRDLAHEAAAGSAVPVGLTRAIRADRRHRAVTRLGAVVVAAVATAAILPATGLRVGVLDRAASAAGLPWAPDRDLPHGRPEAADRGLRLDAATERAVAERAVQLVNVPAPMKASARVLRVADEDGVRRAVVLLVNDSVTTTVTYGDQLPGVLDTSLVVLVGAAGAPAGKLRLSHCTEASWCAFAAPAPTEEDGTLAVYEPGVRDVRLAPRPQYRADGTAEAKWQPPRAAGNGLWFIEVNPRQVRGALAQTPAGVRQAVSGFWSRPAPGTLRVLGGSGAERPMTSSEESAVANLLAWSGLHVGDVRRWRAAGAEESSDAAVLAALAPEGGWLIFSEFADRDPTHELNERGGSGWEIQAGLQLVPDPGVGRIPVAALPWDAATTWVWAPGATSVVCGEVATPVRDGLAAVPDRHAADGRVSCVFEARDAAGREIGRAVLPSEQRVGNIVPAPLPAQR